MNEYNRAMSALDLWKRWFRKSGDPIYRGQKPCCFFCGRVQGRSFSQPKHDRDCIYLEAKEMLERKRDGTDGQTEV